MAKEHEREFLIECIQLYRELPALWNAKSEEYRDRNKKRKAYDLLLEKYREMFPDAIAEDLKKKLNTLRTNYRKELTKPSTSLWYFNEMNFLQDQEMVTDSRAIETQNSTMSVKDEDNKEHIMKNTIVTIDSPQHSTPRSLASRKVPKKSAAKKSRKDEERTDQPFEYQSESNDEYQYWAMACAADLKKMEKTQQIYAKKAIAEILMEGQLGLLQRNSVKINEPSVTLRYGNPHSSSTSFPS